MSAAEKLLEEYIDKEVLSMPGAVVTANKALSAAKSLDLPSASLKTAWAHIYDAMVEYGIEVGNGSVSLPYSKAEKASAAKLQKYLKLIRAETKNYPKNYFGYVAYKRVAGLPINELIQSLDTIVRGKSAPKNRTDGEQKEKAAKYAFRVMKLLGQRAVSTRGASFSMLTASIYGDPDADFHHICRDILSKDKSAKLGKNN